VRNILSHKEPPETSNVTSRVHNMDGRRWGGNHTGQKVAANRFNGVGADRLGAVVSHIPMAEVERFALFGSDLRVHSSNAKFGPAANRGLVARHGLEPPIGRMRKDAGGIR